MKANELMIGDWALYNGKPIKVLQLSEGKDYKNITPIPLTPEILEKNGFKYNPDGYGYPTPIKFYDFPLGKGFFIEEYKDGHYQITDHCFIHFRYVHELQHILRDCGIEKEIEL